MKRAREVLLPSSWAICITLGSLAMITAHSHSGLTLGPRSMARSLLSIKKDLRHVARVRTISKRLFQLAMGNKGNSFFFIFFTLRYLTFLF